MNKILIHTDNRETSYIALKSDLIYEPVTFLDYENYFAVI